MVCVVYRHRYSLCRILVPLVSCPLDLKHLPSQVGPDILRLVALWAVGKDCVVVVADAAAVAFQPMTDLGSREYIAATAADGGGGCKRD